MSDLVLSIRLTADGKGLVGEVRASADELKKFGQAAQQSNTQAKNSADQYVASLKRQAETLGMTKSQTLAYQGSQESLTEAQKRSVAESIRAIDAYDRKAQVLGRLKMAATGAALALAAGLVAALKGTITEAARAEQAHLKLEAVLRATGYAAGLSKSALDAQAESMKRSTGFDDDEIRNSMAVMLTFKQVAGETFGEAMKMAADLSKLMGQDLQSSVLQLGKAMEDPESGLTALRRAGVSFTQTQKDMIKDLVDVGRQSEALTRILQIMREQGIDKVAESMNQGLFKATNDLGRAWDDMLKAFGRTDTVRGTVGGTLGFLKETMLDIQHIIETPDFMDKLKFLFSMGGEENRRATSPLGGWEFSVGGAESRNQIDLNAEDEARRRMIAAQEKGAEFMKEFQTDAEKMGDALRKLTLLYDAGGVSAGQFAAAQAKIRAKFEKPGAGAELIISLKNQVAELERVGVASVTVDKVTRELTESGKKYTAQEKLTIRALAEKADLLIAGKAALDAYLKSAQMESDLQQEFNEIAARTEDTRNAAIIATVRHTEAMQADLKLAEYELSIMGAAEPERERLIAQFKAEAEVTERINDLKRQGIALDEQQIKNMRDQARQGADAAGRAGAIRSSMQEAKRLNEEIGRGLTDALMRGFESGKGFAENFRDSLVNMFKTLVLRPVIQWVLSPISGAITATLGSLGIPGLANAAGMGGVGNVLSAGSSLSSLLSGAAALPNTLFQGLGVATGSQFIADIGNFGFGSPVAGALMNLAMGNTRGALGSGVLGALGAAFGGPIGGLIGSTVGSFFGGGGGGGPASNTGQDFQGTLSRSGLQGSIFSNSANSDTAFRWFYGDFATTFGDRLPALNKQIDAMFKEVTRVGDVLGADASRLANFSANVSFGRFGAGGNITLEQGAAQALAQAGEQMIRQLLPHIDQFAQAGETLTQTFTRLAAATQQLTAAEQQQSNTLSGMARALPGQLGITGLESARDALRISEFHSPTERFVSARSLLDQSFGRAMGGDLAAVQQFPQLLQSALTIGRDVFASGPQFQDLFREGNRQLQDVLGRQQTIQTEIMADLPVTIIEQSRDQIAELKRGFKAVVEQLSTVREELRRIREAA